jgi:hypothetical protein
VVDVDDPLATDIVDNAPQGRFALFDRAASQVATVQMQQIERKVRQPVGAVGGYGVIQSVNVRHASVVRHGDLTIENDGRLLAASTAQAHSQACCLQAGRRVKGSAIVLQLEHSSIGARLTSNRSPSYWRHDRRLRHQQV